MNTEIVNMSTQIVNTEATEAKKRMYSNWEDYSYSKIYLMKLCIDLSTNKEYWRREIVYWTGLSWNDQESKLIDIKTMKNIDFNDGVNQISHSVNNPSFKYIISEKLLLEIKDKFEQRPSDLDIMILINYTNLLLTNNEYCPSFFDDALKNSKIGIPGLLMEFPNYTK